MFPHQVCFKSSISHVLLVTTALLYKICPQAWPLHLPEDNAVCPSSAFSKSPFVKCQVNSWSILALPFITPRSLHKPRVLQSERGAAVPQSPYRICSQDLVLSHSGGCYRSAGVVYSLLHYSGVDSATQPKQEGPAASGRRCYLTQTMTPMWFGVLA